MSKLATTLIALLLAAAAAPGERIKDITDLKGVRGNPLWGYGLVVGLNGTGDNSNISKRALTNILRRSGMTLSPDDISSKNIASVIVTTELPPFARRGSSINVTVNTIGSASSLQGGTLLMTPLLGADGQTYAVAQGPLSVGGFSASGEKSTVTKNHVTVGRIPNGATVEREELADFVENGEIALELQNPDFGTAAEIAKVINKTYPQAAHAPDAKLVRIKIPSKIKKDKIADFVDAVGKLEAKVDFPAVVVINERTGTVIVGQNVGISTVAISIGNLSIITEEKDFVSQPQPFSNTGSTEKVQRTEIKASEERGGLHVVSRSVSVSDLVRAINAMGLTPRDLISIFQELKNAGALQAKLVIK